MNKLAPHDHLLHVDCAMLRKDLQESREETDKLFSLVRDGFEYYRPIDRRHRLIFYMGHVEAFDWNHVARFGLSEPSFEPSLDELFAAGIDPDSTSLPKDTPEDWPALNVVHEYIRRIRARVDELFEHAPEHLLHMAIEHRQMHAETLAYGLHAMPYEAKLGSATWEGDGVPRGENPIREIPAGISTLGRKREQGFGWDNEFCETTLHVGSFAMQKFKVTNGDYLQFVEQGAAAPHFWERQGDDWFYRGMFRREPLPLEAPVYVTWQQAADYAEWKGMALASEAEFHRSAYGTSEQRESEYPWGDEEPSHAHGNFDFAAWEPEPVTAHKAGESAFGVRQLVGNGWEWTSTPFAPFNGFTPTPNYPGYSSNFFDGKHYVLKGGSQRTAARLLRRSFRNWFRPDYPYVYATFRCVER